MYRLLTILFVCYYSGSFAQTGQVVGVVRDSDAGVAMDVATVLILSVEDSSLITYTLTDKNGSFNFNKLPVDKKLFINISHSAYSEFNKIIELREGITDTLTITLSLKKATDLKEVIVTSIKPVRMNGDTLEINPAAFRMQKNAVIEELLNEVGGITIWSDGSISVNGRPVKNVLVDGKSFMGSTDPRIVTQNLPKTAVEKIQVYQEFDRTKIGTETTPADSLLTMNIRLNEESKKGYFGKASAGYGTSDRFDGDLTFQVYNRKTSLGIGTAVNNVNKRIPDIETLFQKNTYRNINPGLFNIGQFGRQGIDRSYLVGASFAHNFVESENSVRQNNLNLSYDHSGSKGFYKSSGFSDQILLDSIQFSTTGSETNSDANEHSARFSYTKSGNYQNSFSVEGRGSLRTFDSRSKSFEETSNEKGESLSRTLESSTEGGRFNSANFTAAVAKSDNENPIRNYSLTVNLYGSTRLDDRKVVRSFESFTDNSSNSVFDRRYISDDSDRGVSLYIYYPGFKRLILGRYNLFGVDINLTQELSHNSNSSKSTVTDFDSTSKLYVPNSALSNANGKSVIDYVPELSFSKTFSKYSEKGYRFISLQASVKENLIFEKNTSSILQRNITRSTDRLLFGGAFNVNTQKRDRYQLNTSLTYGKVYELPGIDLLYPIVDNINPYYIRLGNPYLEGVTTHNARLNAGYSNIKAKSVYRFEGSLSFGMKWQLNAIADSMVNDFSGKRYFHPVNVDGRSADGDIRLKVSRKIGKDQLIISDAIGIHHSYVPNFIDGAKNEAKTNRNSNRLSLTYSINTKFVLNLDQNYERFENRSNLLQEGRSQIRNNSFRFGATFNRSSKLSFSGTLENINNSNLDKNILLVNSFVTCRVMKQQGEIKFSAMDVLKQYRNISNSISNFGSSTTVTNGLQQYFLFTFSYFPRKFGKTELKEKQQGGSGYYYYYEE